MLGSVTQPGHDPDPTLPPQEPAHVTGISLEMTCELGHHLPAPG